MSKSLVNNLNIGNIIMKQYLKLELGKKKEAGIAKRSFHHQFKFTYK